MIQERRMPNNAQPDPHARREISAGIIVYRMTDEGPKILVLYHGHSYWNFPKGKIESEEKSMEAAIRETEEETGLAMKDLKMAPNFQAQERFTFRRAGESVYKVVFFYLAEAMTDKVVISDEHSGYGWFSFSEARRILGKYRDSQRVLRQVADFLKHETGKTKPFSPNARPTSTSPRPFPSSTRPLPPKRPRIYRPHPAWHSGNVRPNRPGNRPNGSGSRSGERT